MFLEDMLDASDLILSLILRELHWLARAIENGSKRFQLRHLS